jgi:hypothetical protein
MIFLIFIQIPFGDMLELVGTYGIFSLFFKLYSLTWCIPFCPAKSVIFQYEQFSTVFIIFRNRTVVEAWVMSWISCYIFVCHSLVAVLCWKTFQSLVLWFKGSRPIDAGQSCISFDRVKGHLGHYIYSLRGHDEKISLVISVILYIYLLLL